MPIQLAKTNAYITNGPGAGTILFAKTNMYVTNGPGAGTVLLAKTNLYIDDNGLPEAPTVELRIPKVDYQVPSLGTTDLQVSKANYHVTYTFPSRDFQINSASYMMPVDQEKVFQVTKANYQVVCLGKVEFPKVLAWTATLDGHDYYFLQLQDITLVYDFHSEQWYNWGSSNRNLWRAQIGINWNANLGEINSGPNGPNISDILVGDNNVGALYLLDPTKNMDDDPEDEAGVLPFQRVVYGQAILRGHDYVACNGIELSGSIGESVVSTDMTISLSMSDDQGHTFFTASDPVTLANGMYNQVVQWRSLGSIRGPGRLFKIEDWGAMYRIDGIDMNDDPEHPSG